MKLSSKIGKILDKNTTSFRNCLLDIPRKELEELYNAALIKEYAPTIVEEFANKAKKMEHSQAYDAVGVSAAYKNCAELLKELLENPLKYKKMRIRVGDVVIVNDGGKEREILVTLISPNHDSVGGVFLDTMVEAGMWSNVQPTEKHLDIALFSDALKESENDFDIDLDYHTV